MWPDDNNDEDSGMLRASTAEQAVATAVTATTSEMSDGTVLVAADSESAWSAVQKSPPAAVPSPVPSHSQPKSTQVPTPPQTIPSDVQNTLLVAQEYGWSSGRKRDGGTKGEKSRSTHTTDDVRPLDVSLCGTRR